MVAKCLTTLDNPFDPFKQPDEWARFDHDHGYHTNAYVARLANVSPDMSEEHEQEEWNRAVEECGKFNILGIYKVVSEETT